MVLEFPTVSLDFTLMSLDYYYFIVSATLLAFVHSVLKRTGLME